VNSHSEGYLKVSFFGPFYGSYVIFELDHKNYQYSFVSGPNKKYLWLLSRTPSVGIEIIEKFIEMSKSRGFDTDGLIFVPH
jgi:apolipoprotein D and lipocalin family protein